MDLKHSCTISRSDSLSEIFFLGIRQYNQMYIYGLNGGKRFYLDPVRSRMTER